MASGQHIEVPTDTDVLGRAEAPVLGRAAASVLGRAEAPDDAPAQVSTEASNVFLAVGLYFWLAKVLLVMGGLVLFFTTTFGGAVATAVSNAFTAMVANTSLGDAFTIFGSIFMIVTALWDSRQRIVSAFKKTLLFPMTTVARLDALEESMNSFHDTMSEQLNDIGKELKLMRGELRSIKDRLLGKSLRLRSKARSPKP